MPTLLIAIGCGALGGTLVFYGAKLAARGRRMHQREGVIQGAYLLAAGVLFVGYAVWLSNSNFIP
jgi:hypothetical protein